MQKNFSNEVLLYKQQEEHQICKKDQLYQSPKQLKIFFGIFGDSMVSIEHYVPVKQNLHVWINVCLYLWLIASMTNGAITTG